MPRPSKSLIARRQTVGAARKAHTQSHVTVPVPAAYLHLPPPPPPRAPPPPPPSMSYLV